MVLGGSCLPAWYMARTFFGSMQQCRRAYSVNDGLTEAAVITVGEHGHTEEDLRYTRRRYYRPLRNIATGS
jgi:hypothetical protein